MLTSIFSREGNPSELVSENDLHEKVKMKQIKMKEYTDKRNNVFQTNFQPGSKVRVKKPWMIEKGEQRNTKPQKGIEKTGPNTYLLEDGRNWNASRLSVIQTLFLWKNQMKYRKTLLHPDHVIADNTITRTSRQRNPSSWMKDTHTHTHILMCRLVSIVQNKEVIPTSKEEVKQCKCYKYTHTHTHYHI